MEKDSKEVISKELSKKSGFENVIDDLNMAIQKLNQEKVKARKELNKVDDTIKYDHNTERELQLRIAKIVEEEAKLSQKRKKIEAKIDQVSTKLRKIAKVKSEMEEI